MVLRMDRPLLRSLRDPVEERLLREALREQANDTGDPLARDMARDVLDGNVTIYEAVASSVYGEVFAQRAEDYAQWWLDLPETERERLYAEGEEAIERAREDGQ